MKIPLWRKFPWTDRTKTEPRPPYKALIVSASIQDRAFFDHLQSGEQWSFVIVPSVAEALTLLRTEIFPVVLCDRDLFEHTWREVLTCVLGSAPRSCFLLVSRVNDEYLWRDVVTQGGYDVLVRPLSKASVTQALGRALYYWRTQPPPLKPVA